MILSELKVGESFKHKGINTTYLTVSKQPEGRSDIKVYNHGTGNYLFLSPNRPIEKVDKIPNEFLETTKVLLKKSERKF